MSINQSNLNCYQAEELRKLLAQFATVIQTTQAELELVKSDNEHYRKCTEQVISDANDLLGSSIGPQLLTRIQQLSTSDPASVPKRKPRHCTCCHAIHRDSRTCGTHGHKCLSGICGSVATNIV